MTRDLSVPATPHMVAVANGQFIREGKNLAWVTTPSQGVVLKKGKWSIAKTSIRSFSFYRVSFRYSFVEEKKETKKNK